MALRADYFISALGEKFRLAGVNAFDAPVRIVADDRENASGVVGELRQRPGVAVEVRRLDTGDFLVAENIVVERKTLGDFAASVIDARLFRQSAAMAAGTRRGVLILEGTRLSAGAPEVPREALQGALITVSVFYGLAVLRARDRTETAQLLVYLGNQAKRFASGTLPRPGYRPKGKRARQLFILQGLPGVGPQRARVLLEHFGSVEAVMKATVDDLTSLDGIGAVTARRMRWALEERPGSYSHDHRPV